MKVIPHYYEIYNIEIIFLFCACQNVLKKDFQDV